MFWSRGLESFAGACRRGVWTSCLPPCISDLTGRTPYALAAHLVVLMVLCSVGILVYQIVWIWNIRQGFIFLAGQPYNEFRMGNQIIRLQVWSVRG